MSGFRSRLRVRWSVAGLFLVVMTLGSGGGVAAGRAPTVAPAGAPSNDDFGSPRVINTLPFNVTQSTVDSTTQTDEPESNCGSDSAESVWFRFTAQATGTIRLHTKGTDYDTPSTTAGRTWHSRPSTDRRTGSASSRAAIRGR